MPLLPTAHRQLSTSSAANVAQASCPWLCTQSIERYSAQDSPERQRSAPRLPPAPVAARGTESPPLSCDGAKPLRGGMKGLSIPSLTLPSPGASPLARSTGGRAAFKGDLSQWAMFHNATGGYHVSRVDP